MYKGGGKVREYKLPQIRMRRRGKVRKTKSPHKIILKILILKIELENEKK